MKSLKVGNRPGDMVANLGVMMKLGNLIDGLNILRTYYDGGDGYHIGCEHDQFYAYKTDKPLTPDDQKRMVELGWFQPDGGMSEDGEEYAPDNGWSSFV